MAEDELRGVWQDPGVSEAPWRQQGERGVGAEEGQGEQDPESEGSHYFRDMVDSEEFSDESTPNEWVPPHILRMERTLENEVKGQQKGKGKGKGGRLKGLQRPGELWRRYTPPSRSTTPSPGKGGTAQPSAAEPSAPSTPGTIDFGAGDEMPFLDGEPYSPGDSYAPSLAPSPIQEHGEETEEEEADPDRVLATVEEEDEYVEEAPPPPVPQPATPKAGYKAPPAA